MGWGMSRSQGLGKGWRCTTLGSTSSPAMTGRRTGHVPDIAAVGPGGKAEERQRRRPGVIKATCTRTLRWYCKFVLNLLQNEFGNTCTVFPFSRFQFEFSASIFLLRFAAAAGQRDLYFFGRGLGHVQASYRRRGRVL